MGCASPLNITREDAIQLLLRKGFHLNNSKLEELLNEVFPGGSMDRLIDFHVVYSYSGDRDDYPNCKWRINDE